MKHGFNENEERQTPNENGLVPNEVPNIDVNVALAQMANAIAMQAGRSVSTPASRIMDFTRMNPPEFYGSKVEEDPQEFVTSKERAELTAYQLKGVAQEWYMQWLELRLVDGPVDWEEFKLAFLDHFFPLEIREAKMKEFINLK